jgi:predicted nucleotidyltransferase
MFEQLLKKISMALDEAGIPYMIIGGQALLLYGEPRLTKDIDVTLGATLEKLDAVIVLAKRNELKPLVDPETFTRKTMVLPCQDRQTGIRVDFIFSFSPYETQALKRVRKVKFGNVQIKFASPEDLIIHKIIAGRPRDIEDVKNVLIKNPGINLAYVRQWLQEFTTALEEPFVERFDAVAKTLEL